MSLLFKGFLNKKLILLNCFVFFGKKTVKQKPKKKKGKIKQKKSFFTETFLNPTLEYLPGYFIHSSKTSNQFLCAYLRGGQNKKQLINHIDKNLT